MIVLGHQMFVCLFHSLTFNKVCCSILVVCLMPVSSFGYTNFKSSAKFVITARTVVCFRCVYFSRQTRYKGTPRNVYRHIVISEIKEATAALPPV